MISDETDNERTELEVLTEHASACPRTEGVVHGRVSVRQQALPGRQSITARKSNIKTSRVSNRKIKWSHEENRYLWECYERSCYPSRAGYMARMRKRWIDAEMRDISAQRLSTQVKNIEKRSILSKVERQQIHAKVIGTDQDQSEGEDTLQNKDDDSEEMQGEIANNQEADYDPDVIDEMFVSFNETFEFRGFEEEEYENPEDDIIIKRIKEVMDDCKEGNVQLPSIKNIEWKKVKKTIEKVNAVLERVDTHNLTELNLLLKAAGVVIGERVGIKQTNKKGNKKEGSSKEPWWKRRLENSICEWRKDVSRLEEVRKGNHRLSETEKKRLNRKYELDAKGYLHIIHQLKVKIKRAGVNIRQYKENQLQYYQNNLFKTNRSRLFRELSGDDNTQNDSPDPEEATKFWKDIWETPSTHNRRAEWLADAKDKLQHVERQNDISITLEDVKFGIRRMASWKSPGPDGVQGFWFKKLTNLHGRMANELQSTLESGSVPEWLTVGRTVLIMKDVRKGRIASNYRPIACLPLMWKLLTGVFAEKIYDHLAQNLLLPNEQKGCRKDSRGTKDQLLIDKAILRNCRKKCKGLAVGWIDYKKAYDMVPHTWLKEAVELVGIAENVKRVLFSSMERWKTILTSNNEVLGEVNIRRGIFQGDTLSPLLFVIVLIPLSMIIREMDCGYQLGKGRVKINHLLFMDDLKLYGRTERELNSLVNTVHIFSEDIGMKFGMDKCNVLLMQRGRMKHTEGIKLPDGELMKEIESSGYKYLGMLQDDMIRHKEMKEKLEEEYIRRVKKVVKSKLNAKNMINGINEWAVGVIRYSAGVIDWTLQDIKRMDVKTRKQMTMNGALHPRANVGRIYLKRNEGGRGLLSVEECVLAETKGLSEYIGRNEEPMLIQVREENIFNEEETKEEYQKRLHQERVKGFKEKSLHGKFRKSTEAIADERSWEWLKMGYLKKGTEAIITAAQDQALRTNWIKAVIDKQNISPKCRVCQNADESAMHIASGCEGLAKRQYKIRHDTIGRRVHWELCRKYGIECSEKWYQHIPEKIVTTADEKVEILWDDTIDGSIKHNRPDITVKDKTEKKWYFVDVTVPQDHRVVMGENEKIDKYLELATKVRIDNHVKVEIIPIVIGAMGTIPKRLKGYIGALGIPDIIGGAQTSALIGTAKILRSVLSL